MSSLGFSVGFSLGAALGAPSAGAAPPARGSWPGYFTADGTPSPPQYGQGDLEPDLVLVVVEARPEGVGVQPMDLSTVETASLRWRKPDGSLVTRAIDIEPELGRLRFTWEAGDTAIVGEHRAQVLLTWPGGEVQTVPSSDTPFRWRVRAPV